MQAFDHVSIEVLNLSRRTYHALVRSGVSTIGRLEQFYLKRSANQIRMIGEKSLDEISKALGELHKNPTLLALIEREPVQLPNPEDKRVETTSKTSIDVLNLSGAIKGVLKKHGIKTIDDLRETSDSTLLNIKLIGPKKLMEIKSHLVEFVERSNVPVVNELIINKPITIVEKKIITWSQVIEDYFRNEKDVYIYILISRFGYAPKTLEGIAAELGVTRERVRQIQEAVAVRYLKHIRFSGALELLEKIEEVFSVHGEDLSLIGLKAILKREGILGQFSETVTTEHIKHLDLLETLFCWLSLLSNKRYTLRPIEFSVDISNLSRSGKISIRDHATLVNVPKKELRKIKRKVLFTGGITIKEASKILSTDERSTVLVLKNLNLQKIDNEWFSLKNLDEDKDNSKIPLRAAGLKILAVTPEIDSTSFHDGLRKYASRFYASISPLHVIEHCLPKLGFEINNSRISTQLSVRGVLSQSEQSLVSAIRKNGGIASFLEIAEEFFLRNLSLPAVSVTLKRSPIAEKISDGFHKLRGTEISWQDIEIAQKRQRRFAQDDEITHGLDGIVRMRFTVNSYAFLTGVVGAWSVKELSGSWTVLQDSSPFGDAKIDDPYLWGLAKLFKKIEVKMGDRMELAFNTWNRTLSVRKVNNENS